jgi:hypothetical protein
MIEFLIGKISDFIGNCVAEGGTLSLLKGYEYGFDLNNIKNLPALRFFLSDFSADRLDRADITFDFIILSSGFGDSVQNRRMVSNALLWGVSNGNDIGVLPFIRSLRTFSAIDTKNRAWCLSNITTPEILIGNKGAAAQYAIAFKAVFSAKWPYI